MSRLSDYFDAHATYVGRSRRVVFAGTYDQPALALEKRRGKIVMCDDNSCWELSPNMGRSGIEREVRAWKRAMR